MPGAAQERGAAIEAAADLLALAMHESHGPVDVLGGALERMAAALAQYSLAIDRQREIGPHRAGPRADESLGDLDKCRETLEREITVCIESLQFHDRLMQRLARVANYLAALTGDSRAGADLRRVNLTEGSIELF
ncbi:MAG: hypothetical protein WBE92_14290 [Steroidobacteraceae bacterium]